MNNKKIYFCQYQKKGCQKIATFQHFVKLGTVTVDKGWACGNCKQYLEKQRNHEQ